MNWNEWAKHYIQLIKSLGCITHTHVYCVNFHNNNNTCIAFECESHKVYSGHSRVSSSCLFFFSSFFLSFIFIIEFFFPVRSSLNIGFGFHIIYAYFNRMKRYAGWWWRMPASSVWHTNFYHFDVYWVKVIKMTNGTIFVQQTNATVWRNWGISEISFLKFLCMSTFYFITSSWDLFWQFFLSRKLIFINKSRFEKK